MPLNFSICGKLIWVVILWLWKKRIKKDSCSCQKNYLQSKFYCSELQLNAALHHPCTFLPLGKEWRVGLAEFHHPGLTHSRLSPWPSWMSVAFVQPSTAQRPCTQCYHMLVFPELLSAWRDPQRRQEHGVHSHQRPLEDSSPRSWHTELKAK